MSRSQPDNEEVLTCTQPLRALVRDLVRDEHAVEDVLQETQLAVLRHQPRSDRARWMRATARNLARNRRRKDERAVRRERTASRHETTPSALDMVARMERLQALVEALRGLPQPYRDALGRRYLDGVPPRRIARETGSSIGTVKTHLARGLRLLRERMDSEHGGNRLGWCIPLLPMAGPERGFLAGIGGTTAAVSGVVAMKIKIAVTLGIALAFGLGWFAIRDDGSSGGDAPTRDEPRAPTMPAAEGSQDVNPIQRTSRFREDQTQPNSSDPANLPAASGQGWSIAGRVIDQSGYAIPGIHLQANRLEQQRRRIVKAQAPTDNEGRFRIRRLAPGQWNLMIWPHPPDPHKWKSLPTLQVEAGDNGVEVVLSRKEPGTIRLHVDVVDGVTGARLEPVAQRCWLISSQHGALGLETRPGTVAHDRLWPGDWKLHVGVQDGREVDHQFTASLSEPVIQFTLYVEPPGRVEGRVQSDGPLPKGALVWISSGQVRGLHKPHTLGTCSVGPDGSFGFVDVPKGTYEIRLRSETVSAARVISVTPANTTNTILLAESSAKLELRVHAAPLASSARVWTRRPGGPWTMRTDCDRSGRTFQSRLPLAPGDIEWRVVQRTTSGDSISQSGGVTLESGKAHLVERR